MNKISIHRHTPYFSISLALNQGPHEYKFIVDGVWRHDPNSHTVLNSFGILNNYVEVKMDSVRFCPKKAIYASILENY